MNISFVSNLWIIKFLKFSQREEKRFSGMWDFNFIEKRISKKLAATWIEKKYLWNRLWWIKLWKTRRIFATMLSLCLLLNFIRSASRVCLFLYGIFQVATTATSNPRIEVTIEIINRSKCVFVSLFRFRIFFLFCFWIEVQVENHFQILNWLHFQPN